jgi:glycosyltransferase involved in cell wall biosynthesis
MSIIHKPLEPRIFERECRELAAAGHEVHLIVAGPPRERLEGIRFHSIAPDSDRPSPRHQVGRLLRSACAAWRLRPSIFHLHDPHLIPLGALLQLGGSRVVYDVHEDYVAYARAKHPTRPLRGALKALAWTLMESLARRRFDAFVCASQGLARAFPSDRTVVIHNFPRHRVFASAADQCRPYRERPNTVIITGYLRGLRCFWQIAQALELLPESLDCRLRAIGAFRPPELEFRARSHPVWRKLDLLPWQPHEVVIRELFDARIGLNLVAPVPNYDDPISSNKLFEYMAAGIPQIISDMTPWRELVCGIGCGLVVDPNDPEAIAAAIKRLLNHPAEAEAMGRRGQEAVSARFNWEGEANRVLSLYQALGTNGAGATHRATVAAWPARRSTRSV